MDRRKFIQTGIAGVAGLSLVRTFSNRPVGFVFRLPE